MTDFVKAYQRNPVPMQYCPVDSDEDLLRLVRFAARLDGVSVTIVSSKKRGTVAQLEGESVPTRKWTLDEMLGNRIVFDGSTFELWPGEEFDTEYTSEKSEVGSPREEIPLTRGPKVVEPEVAVKETVVETPVKDVEKDVTDGR